VANNRGGRLHWFQSTRRKEVVFVAVGDGDTLEASKKFAADVGTLKFLGKRKNVEEIVATFDIGVLSAFMEGISNSVMEYMADSLAAKIEYLLDNPDTARHMGEAGEARLKRDFSLTRVEGTVKLYELALTNAKRRPVYSDLREGSSES
jgi:glycosyl transferase family 1